MLIVFVSVLIFGWVHPVSKLLLDQGVPLSYFCVLYVGIRLQQTTWVGKSKMIGFERL